jgi:outer membrane murein-binding lipoprotein Lpp
MGMKKTGVLFIALVLILACAGAGCVQPSEEEAEAQLCQDLGELGAALESMENTSLRTSVGDLREGRDQVQSAMEGVRESAGQLANVRVDELNAAYEDLDQAVENLSDDVTVIEGIQAIRPQIQAVRAEQQNLYTDLNCTGQ